MKILINTIKTGSKCWLPINRQMSRGVNVKLMNGTKWEKVVVKDEEVYCPEHKKE